jgi:hypothetical protein
METINLLHCPLGTVTNISMPLQDKVPGMAFMTNERLPSL